MEVKVIINGSEEILGHGSTVWDVLTSKDVRPEMVAVEINGELLHKDKYKEIVLQEGDSMEFLHYMAGGA